MWRSMANPLRDLQMGFASAVGASALRHGKRWRWQNHVTGFAQVHLDGVSYVLLQILSGDEKQGDCGGHSAARIKRFCGAGPGF